MAQKRCQKAKKDEEIMNMKNYCEIITTIIITTKKIIKCTSDKLYMSLKCEAAIPLSVQKQIYWIHFRYFSQIHIFYKHIRQ